SRRTLSHGSSPTVHLGPIWSTDRVVSGRLRTELAAGRPVAVDMESAWLADLLAGNAPIGQRAAPIAVVRVVSDSASHDLGARTLWNGAVALLQLSRVLGAVEAWSKALQPREVLLAAHRSFCAGVDRAVKAVEAVLASEGPPIFVRRQIVHNSHVVADLEGKGAVFVHELDEVPTGGTVVFSAHGVPPAARELAELRRLRTLDATCPLVAKVHAEARRFARAGREIVLVGHAGHDEVEGTMGEAPMRVVERPEEVDGLDLEPGAPVAYLTQTTLSLDDAASTVAALRARYPGMAGPPSSDICYASQNRQRAVADLASRCDVMLIVGSANSSNSRRLVEVAERAGCPAYLVDGPSEVRLGWLAGAGRVGLTAGASAPESLLHDVLVALRGLGPVEVTDLAADPEQVHFAPVKLTPVAGRTTRAPG
ncbi:MAG: 4-hydroxy-3-methylbut-2-enyl diphosphate reductase, partial [Acidimicrobiales bacterium]